jgi:uncharacterized protein YcaQ
VLIKNTINIIYRRSSRLPSQSAVLQALEALNNAYRASGTATAEDLQKFWDVEKFNIQAMAKKLRQTNNDVFEEYHLLGYDVV